MLARSENSTGRRLLRRLTASSVYWLNKRRLSYKLDFIKAPRSAEIVERYQDTDNAGKRKRKPLD